MTTPRLVFVEQALSELVTQTPKPIRLNQTFVMNTTYYVYILTNTHNTTLYTGVTNNLQRRVAEHKLHLNSGFSDRYNTEKLVYYETFPIITDAIHREKQLKKWDRDWKEKVIGDFNPQWIDLADSIGVDEGYLQSIQAAFDNGTLWR